MRHPIDRLISLANWWGGIDKLGDALNYSIDHYQINYQKFSSLFDCCSIDGIRFMNEGLGKDKLEKFFEVPIPEFEHRADKPVSFYENKSKRITYVPNRINLTAKKLLNKEIEFYKRSVENF